MVGVCRQIRLTIYIQQDGRRRKDGAFLTGAESRPKLSIRSTKNLTLSPFFLDSTLRRADGSRLATSSLRYVAAENPDWKEEEL